LDNGEVIESESCLLALGRSPNTAELNLKEVGVKLDSNGGVKVDEYQNSSVPGIYAIGDATNNIQLTPVAVKAGRIVAERIFNNRTDLKMNYDNVATVVFSHPPIGVVGLTESQAFAKFGKDKIKVYKSKFANMFYSLAKDDSKKMGTLFKLVCHIQENGEEKIIGCHCIGKSSDEMIQVVSVALNMGATKKDFDKTVAIHPTASEELVLMEPKLY
jgi:glutathione reductase (NADPH)